MRSDQHVDRERRIASILEHSSFLDARRSHIEQYLAVFSGDPALNKLLADGARHVVITFVLCLDAAQRDDNPESWLTLGKLQDIVTAHQVGSPGLVEAIVTRMIDRGLLTSTPAATDRRKRIVRPTEALIEHDLDLLAAQAAPCLLVAPTPALKLCAARDRGFQRAQRLASISAFGDAMQLLSEHPEMMIFIARDSGYMVLLSLLSSALASPNGMLSTARYQDIGDRFGVSRAHVRDTVEAAADAGLVHVGAQGGTAVEITPTLWSAHDRWTAACMELFDRCCTAGLAMLTGSATVSAS